MEWEAIDEHSARSKAPGGWLVKHSQVIVIQVPVPSKDIIGTHKMAELPTGTMGMTFVPDPDYEWKVEKFVPKTGPSGLVT